MCEGPTESFVSSANGNEERPKDDCLDDALVNAVQTCGKSSEQPPPDLHAGNEAPDFSTAVT